MALTRRLLLGTGAALLAPAMRARAASPLLIGFITSLSGPQEVFGRPMLTGARIAADQVNAAGGVLGRRVEILDRDDGADPDRAVAQLKELTGNGVNLLAGIVTSPVGLATSPAAAQANAVLMTCLAATDKLTHDNFNPHYFRVSDQTVMRNRAQARLMVERYPEVTNWAALIPDMEYGHSAYAAFRQGLREASNGKATLAEPILSKFGAEDFTQQIAALKASPAEGVFIAVYGGDAVALYRQAGFSSTFGHVKVLADSVNEVIVPMELGSATPENLWLGMTWYHAGYGQLPMARALYEDNLRRTGEALPLGMIETGHAAVLAYAAAIRKAGKTDTDAVIKALEGLTFDTAKGPVTFRPEDHQAIGDVNLIRMKGTGEGAPLDILDYVRSGYEVAEFVRLDGASVIEPPSPGKPIDLGN